MIQRNDLEIDGIVGMKFCITHDGGLGYYFKV